MKFVEYDYDKVRTREITFDPDGDGEEVTYEFAEGDDVGLVIDEDGNYLSEAARVFDEQIAGYIPTEIFEADEATARAYVETELYN